MKHRIFISFILFSTVLSFKANAQTNKEKSVKKGCNCGSNKILSNIINCDTIYFKNDSKLYRQFNCDSSWLTFESKRGRKRIMETFRKGGMEFTGRIGYRFIKEYKKSLLFQNRQASGGGFPINYELINKKNGEIIEKFGTIIYYSDANSKNFVLYLSSDGLDTVTYYNIETETKFNFAIPSGRLTKTVRESSQPFAEYLFEKPEIKNNILILKYKYLVDKQPAKWSEDGITINLKTIDTGAN